MKTKYDYNPLMKLYNILDRSIYQLKSNPPHIDNDEFTDEVISTMLGYNSVKFKPNAQAKTVEICNDIYLYLLYNAEGNDYNEVFDYVEVYGSSYIIIFMDYFKSIKTVATKVPDDNTSIEERLDYMMGNSKAFDAICNIVNFFIKLTSRVKPNPGSIQDKINSTAPTMIAAYILNKFKPLEENDCESSIIPYNRILELGNVPITKLLTGIF